MTTFELHNPGSVELTLTATFTMAEWREIAKRLRESNLVPGNKEIGWYFCRAVDDMVAQITASFWPKPPE